MSVDYCCDTIGTTSTVQCPDPLSPCIELRDVVVTSGVIDVAATGLDAFVSICTKSLADVNCKHRNTLIDYDCGMYSHGF